MGSSDSRLTAQLGSQVGHWIAGADVAGGAQDRYGDVFNPATGELARRVSLASPEQVDAAVKAAAAAFPAWSAMPALRRARVMFKFKELAERHSAELAAAITAEHGKVFSDAEGEVIRGLEVVEFACGIPQLLKGEFSEQVGTESPRPSTTSRAPSATPVSTYPLTLSKWVRVTSGPISADGSMPSATLIAGTRSFRRATSASAMSPTATVTETAMQRSPADP